MKGTGAAEATTGREPVRVRDERDRQCGETAPAGALLFPAASVLSRPPPPRHPPLPHPPPPSPAGGAHAPAKPPPAAASHAFAAALPPPVMHSQPLVASAAHRWPPIPAVVTVAWRGGGDRADDGGGSAALRHPCWPPHPASGDWVANATLVFFSRFGWVARRPPRAIAVSGGGCAPPVLVIWGQGGIFVHAGRRHAVSPVQGRCEPRIQVAYAS